MDKKPGQAEKPAQLAPRTAPPPPSNFSAIWVIRGLLLLGVALPFISGRWGYVVCSEAENIYTVEESLPRAKCFSVRDGYIQRVGSLEHVLDSGPSWRTLLPGILNDALNSFLFTVKQLPPDVAVVPGLADAHAHVIENGYMLQLPLAGAQSVEEIITRIKSYLEANPDVAQNKTRWIEGMGWDHTRWPEAKFPTASDFDQEPLLRGRLISLSRVDGHAKWVSRAVLDLMTIPDHVNGGEIIRDANGSPTGIFMDNAMDLIPVPAWDDGQVSKFYDATIKLALSYGLTSIHDADSKPFMIDFYKNLAEKGELPNRMYLMGYMPLPNDEYWGDKIPRLVNYGKHGRLTLRSVKIFADGALGSWGAALLAPYSDKPESNGLLIRTPEKMTELVHRFWKDGWQTNVHCIGDRANHLLLDIYEDILEHRGGNVTDWRPRIEHSQIFSQDDLKRMGRLGVIASVQPTHATSDMWYAESRLGPDRIKGAYAYQTLLRASPFNVLPLGSDFPVEHVNPLFGFYAATTRLSPAGTSPHGPNGWYPQEKLSREQALKGMTLDAAFASFAEHELGSIKVGKKADFVVFDRNIMTVKDEEILDAKVLATVVDGDFVYGGL